MNALVRERPCAVAAIDWPLAAATQPKPSPVEEPEPPVSQPEPSKPGTPTRAADACLPQMPNPSAMMLAGWWQGAALAGAICMTIAISSVMLPFEAALLPFSQSDE
jgi:hypothetical protein